MVIVGVVLGWKMRSFVFQARADVGDKMFNISSHIRPEESFSRKGL